MNDSVATTTRAEVKIQSRGFLARVFFGGDREAAEILDKETERNQESIEALTRLLEEGGLSAGNRTALSAQITALEEAQAGLRALAARQRKRWGLFSSSRSRRSWSPIRSTSPLSPARRSSCASLSRARSPHGSSSLSWIR